MLWSNKDDVLRETESKQKKIKKELNSQEISDEWTQYNRHYLQVSQPNQLMLTDFLLEMVDIFILPVERLAREHIFVPSLDLQS